MANPEHLKILKQGVKIWNKWREENPDIEPDLRDADLRKANLCGVNLSKTDLSGADLNNADLSGEFLYSLFDKNPKEIIKDKQESDLIRHDMYGSLLEEGGPFRYVRITDLREARLIETRLNGANLKMANLSGANLSLAMLVGANLENVDLQKAILHEARLNRADLSRANLNKAELKKADLLYTNLFDANFSDAKLPMVRLSGARLFGTNLIRANLSGANLTQATFVKTQLEGTNLSNCCVYGISAWDLKTDKETKQLSLVITDYREPVITVDNLEVAQFIYLLLNNEKIRDVIDTIGKKAVLILGRFTKERKDVLDAIREELRKLDYLPILFDFDKPASKDLTETISTLAHMARFIIADITEPKCIPHELATIVPTLSVPVKPLLLKGSTGEYAMFKDLKQRYHWVLAVYRYKSQKELVESLEPKVIVPAEKKAKALTKRKSR